MVPEILLGTLCSLEYTQGTVTSVGGVSSPFDPSQPSSSVAGHLGGASGVAHAYGVTKRGDGDDGEPMPKFSPKRRRVNHQKKRSSKDARILQLNVDGWRGKKDILNKLIEDVSVDVVILQEIKLEKLEQAPKTPEFVPLISIRKIQRTGTEQQAQGA